MGDDVVVQWLRKRVAGSSGLSATACPLGCVCWMCESKVLLGVFVLQGKGKVVLQASFGHHSHSPVVRFELRRWYAAKRHWLNIMYATNAWVLGCIEYFGSFSF